MRKGNCYLTFFLYVGEEKRSETNDKAIFDFDIKCNINNFNN